MCYSGLLSQCYIWDISSQKWIKHSIKSTHFDQRNLQIEWYPWPHSLCSVISNFGFVIWTASKSFIELNKENDMAPLALRPQIHTVIEVSATCLGIFGPAFCFCFFLVHVICSSQLSFPIIHKLGNVDNFVFSKFWKFNYIYNSDTFCFEAFLCTYSSHYMHKNVKIDKFVYWGKTQIICLVLPQVKKKEY